MLVLERILKHLLLKHPLLPALVLALAAPLAHADPGGGRLAGREAERRDFPAREPQRFQHEAPPPRRDEGGAGEAQRTQRFSPDERRQLRRDVHDAGRDLYAPRR